MKNKLTRHHLIPKSKGGTNHPDNITGLTQNVHRAFHQVFINDTPVEQFVTLVGLNETALKYEFKVKLLRLLCEDDAYIYEKGVMKPKNMK